MVKGYAQVAYFLVDRVSRDGVVKGYAKVSYFLVEKHPSSLAGVAGVAGTAGVAVHVMQRPKYCHSSLNSIGTTFASSETQPR